MSGDGGQEGRSADHIPSNHQGAAGYGAEDFDTAGSGTRGYGTRAFNAKGSGIRSSGEPGGGKPDGHGERGGRLCALTRSWATGALVHLAAGFLTSRSLVEPLGTEARLETFGWRLSLLHLPALTVTLLTVLAAARILPEEHRESRTLYLFAVLAVPLAGLAYGFAISSSSAAEIEGVLMPMVSLAAGATSGVAVDRLLEERATRPPPPPTYAYNWRDRGSTSAEYLVL